MPPPQKAEGKEFQHFRMLEPVSQWEAPKGERKSGMPAWGACRRRSEGTAPVRC